MSRCFRGNFPRAHGLQDTIDNIIKVFSRYNPVIINSFSVGILPHKGNGQPVEGNSHGHITLYPVGKGIIRSGQRRIGFQDIMPWHDLRRVCCTARHHNTQIGSYTVQNHHRALLPDFRINGVPEIAYSDIAFCWCKFKSHLSPLPPAHSLTRRFGRLCQRRQRHRL